MRIKKIFVCVIIFFFFPLVICSYGADVAKIGLVDFQRLLKLSTAGKQAMAELNGMGKGMEADLKKREAEIEKLKKDYEREALVMNKETRDQKERDLRIKINDFKSLATKYKKDLRTVELEKTQKMQKDVYEIVQKIGKKEGYLLIVEKLEGGVLYFPNSIDITDKVVLQYNASYAQESDKGSNIKKK